MGGWVGGLNEVLFCMIERYLVLHLYMVVGGWVGGWVKRNVPNCPHRRCFPYSRLSSRRLRTLLSSKGLTGAFSTAVQKTRKESHLCWGGGWVGGWVSKGRTGALSTVVQKTRKKESQLFD